MHQAKRIAKPRYSTAIIDRGRLYDVLGHWRDYPGTLVHAPAGYGKSTLISRWIDIAHLQRNTAWLSVNSADADPRQFMLSISMALDTRLPGTLTTIQRILSDPHNSVGSALDHLLSMLAQRTSGPEAQEKVLLVLDDVHLAYSPEVNTLLGDMLDADLPQLHVVLITRQSVVSPIARHVTRQHVLVIGLELLRFTPGEIQDYAAAQSLPAPDQQQLNKLAERSEGWIAALQLATISLRQGAQIDRLINAMRGNSDWLAAFLEREVFETQSEPLRTFLVKTSILDGFNNALCMAVTDDPASYSHIETLKKANLFLVEIGDGVKDEPWHRYHHLFQEFLHHQLLTSTDASTVAGLHQRAAGWLAEAGQTTDAVRHYVAAGCDVLAAQLIEALVAKCVLVDPMQAEHYISLLPNRLVTRRPRLMLHACRIAILLTRDDVVKRVREAAATLEAVPDDPENTALRTELVVWRASAHFLQRDLAACADAASQALRDADLLDDFALGTLHFLRMHLCDHSGDRAGAQFAAELALAAYQRADAQAARIALLRELAARAMRAAQTDEVQARLASLFGSAADDKPLSQHELAWAHYVAGEHAYWRNNLPAARAHQAAMQSLAELLRYDEMMLIATAADTAYRAAAGEYVERRSADELAVGSAFRSVIARAVYFTFSVRHLLASGKAQRAWQLALDYGLSIDVVTPYYADYALIPFCQAYIGRGAALGEIQSLLTSALALRQESGNRLGQLHLLALLAWQRLGVGDERGAIAALTEAYGIARSSGYVRALLDIPDLSRFLQESTLTVDKPSGRDSLTRAPHSSTRLTDQEQLVLRQLASDSTYAQIAAAMVISINTVRTHVRHIYRKLGVKRRDQSILAAYSLGLLNNHDEGPISASR